MSIAMMGTSAVAAAAAAELDKTREMLQYEKDRLERAKDKDSQSRAIRLLWEELLVTTLLIDCTRGCLSAHVTTSMERLCKGLWKKLIAN